MVQQSQDSALTWSAPQASCLRPLPASSLLVTVLGILVQCCAISELEVALLADVIAVAWLSGQSHTPIGHC